MTVFRCQPWRIVLVFVWAFVSMAVVVGVPLMLGLTASGEDVVLLLAGVGVVSIVWLWSIFRLGIWAARIDPPAGIAAVPVAELRQRILALNTLDLPFHVSEDASGRLVAEWKLADARWSGEFESGGVVVANRVRLRIAEPQTVRAIDFQTRISWRGGVARARWFGSIQFFRGIVFRNFSAGAEHGLLFKNGRWQVSERHKYRFDIDELKQPLVQAVVLSGWTWQPAVFR